MKKALLALIFTLTISISNAQYSTPGTGVNWTLTDLVNNSEGVVTNASDTTFEILSNLTISSNDTLTFYDGYYDILCDEDVLITVNGVIQFEGDTSLSGNMIKFHPAANAYFTGFRFQNSQGSFLFNTFINNAGGIKLIESDVEFRNCSFSDFNIANSTGAVDIFQSKVTVYNCLFSNNEGAAIKSAANANSSPKIINCTLNGNVTAGLNMPQINLGTSASDDTILISGCTITGETGTETAGGIAVSTLAGGELNCIIENNIIENNRYGIAVYGNNINSLIKNNIIENNDIQNDPMQGGSGISFWGNETNVSVVSGNTIKNNLWGITILNAAHPDLGNDENENSPGNNEIYGNGNNGSVYDVYNNTPGDIKAENNYWGTDNADTIELHIFHHPDDPSLGYVDFIPFNTYTSVKEKKNNPNGKPNIYPLPAYDFVYVTLTGNKKIKRLKLFNMDGRIVLNIPSGKKKNKLDISYLPAGVYILSVECEDKTFSGKIIKN